jgi:uroporphyrinogen decarboxylase
MLIVGWVEGAFAEYADLRGLSDACLDLYDNPQKVRKTCDILFELAAEFAKQQIKAGANCIGIGEAACSQISPDLYRQFFFTYDKELVESVHSLGAIAKIHICGNISGILNDLIKTGADIIDVDHMVTAVPEQAKNLGKQVFSGSIDPVSVLENGRPETILKAVKKCFDEADRRMIVSAGCEVTPGTPIENFKALCESARSCY